MKKIVYDLLCSQPSNNIKFHGGGEYGKAIFKYLVENYSRMENISIEVCYNMDIFIDDWIKTLINKYHIIVHDVKKINDIINVLNSYELYNRVVFYTPLATNYQINSINLNDNVYTIGTCHGLRNLEKPYDQNSWRYYSGYRRIKEIIKSKLLRKYINKKHYFEYELCLQNFDSIITVSNHSSNSIKFFLPKLSNKRQIQVLYTPPKVGNTSFNKSFDTEPYILLISADRWEKNVFRAIEAIDTLYNKGYLKEMSVKIVGNYPFRLKKRIKNITKFQFYHYISSEELENLYCHCDIFLYPTLNEGFGMPPLEAMKYKKTCIVSGVCSLPEIYGDAVYYCNPYDVSEIANRILLASTYRISESVISKQYKLISDRQESDLIKLCNFILKS